MYTPWGQPDYSCQIEPGLTWVSTPSHGGFMAARGWAEKHLTQEARAEGEVYGGYIAFEEDCAWPVVVFEHPSPVYERVFGAPLAKLMEDAKHTIAYWLPIYAIRRDLDVNRERAREMSQERWYRRAGELADLLALTD